MPISGPLTSGKCFSVEAVPASPLRILVVEDNTDLCQLVCELLRDFGHIALAVGTAESALAKFDAGAQFDILLSDVSLPGMSGIDLARKARMVAPDMQIIFASGYSALLTKNIGFPVHWLTKPYDIDYLHQLLLSLRS